MEPFGLCYHFSLPQMDHITRLKQPYLKMLCYVSKTLKCETENISYSRFQGKCLLPIICTFCRDGYLTWVPLSKFFFAAHIVTYITHWTSCGNKKRQKVTQIWRHTPHKICGKINLMNDWWILNKVRFIYFEEHLLLFVFTN